jgi:hypothetical protein
MTAVSTRAAVRQGYLLKRACRISEKKMPPRGAPSVTQPVVRPFLAVNHWLTTLNAMVVGIAAGYHHPL